MLVPYSSLYSSGKPSMLFTIFLYFRYCFFVVFGNKFQKMSHEKLRRNRQVSSIRVSNYKGFYCLFTAMIPLFLCFINGYKKSLGYGWYETLNCPNSLSVNFLRCSQ